MNSVTHGNDRNGRFRSRHNRSGLAKAANYRKVVREVRERRRTGKALQHGDGVPCPHLLERHTLPDPSLQPCVEEAAVRCGGGVQTRQLTCVRAADHVPVADDLCVHVEPPPRVQRCEVGCERDCVVGPWSAWGVCTPTDCTASPPPATPGFQRRRREIVVTPSSGGAECPPLEEQSECHEAQCHQWVLGPWSSCQMDNLAHSCGPGHQTRNATCLDSAGVPAPMEECRGVGSGAEGAVSATCPAPSTAWWGPGQRGRLAPAPVPASSRSGTLSGTRRWWHLRVQVGPVGGSLGSGLWLGLGRSFGQV
ncbi:Thrombospondin type-1 domain-containing protein 7B [Penaeus vannamei]|uniref:Thrombospondin type-1 domain-containing protein 7B n=1 Tax=Penaeus vannamei TaxID=6689 RepID=A0A3R7LWB0_PENVA|nr:Thrombospondin type-1 domain-containing protein 7B [Penaeus vannamei]